ncbi:MAG: carboxymuconolactone decarboxylase family protein [Deinococcales bacterium]
MPRQKKNLDPRAAIWGQHKEKITQRLQELDPDLERYVREFAYGTVYARGVLPAKTQELLAIVMLCALGNPGEMKTHLRGALINGASEAEVREALLFAIPYLGFPRVIGAFAYLQEVLQAKKNISSQNLS